MSVAGRQRKRKIIMPGSTREGGGLVLPGDFKPGMRTLHVPREYADEDVVIVGVCTTCDATFYRGHEEEWQKHVGWCARRNLGAIMDAREEQKKRMAVFDEANWDPEWAEHQRKVGKRMLAEGRLVPKPNER